MSCLGNYRRQRADSHATAVAHVGVQHGDKNRWWCFGAGAQQVGAETDSTGWVNPLRIHETIRNRGAVVPWFSNGRTRHWDRATELVTACAVVGGRTRVNCLCLFVHGIGSGVVCVERAVLQI